MSAQAVTGCFAAAIQNAIGIVELLYEIQALEIGFVAGAMGVF